MEDKRKMQQQTTDGSERGKGSRITNSKVRDSSAKLIFGNATLCSQLLRDYGDLEILKNIRAEDIEDVTERFIPMFTEERDADVVKKIRLADGEEMFVISLIDHKSSVDYNVIMQLMRYMVFIWEDYEKQMEKEHPGISKTKGFKYPPILPIVYYEDTAEWTAAEQFQDRIFLSEVFSDFVPHFRYKLVQLQNYTKETLLKNDDELALVMLINKLRHAEEFRHLNVPEEFIKRVAKEAPGDVLDIMARVVATLLRKIDVPEEEVSSFTDQIKERKMGELFEHFEPYSVRETRKNSEKIGEIKGEKKTLIRLICRKLARGKDLAQICDEVEDLEENVKPIYDIAITFAPDYSPEKVMEKMGITPIEEE